MSFNKKCYNRERGKLTPPFTLTSSGYILRAFFILETL